MTDMPDTQSDTPSTGVAVSGAPDGLLLNQSEIRDVGLVLGTWLGSLPSGTIVPTSTAQLARRVRGILSRITEMRRGERRRTRRLEVTR